MRISLSVIFQIFGVPQKEIKLAGDIAWVMWGERCYGVRMSRV